MTTYPTICFTGHRTYPADKRPFIVKRLRQIITETMAAGTRTYITGGALGVDQIAAFLVARARHEAGMIGNFSSDKSDVETLNERVGLLAVIPFSGYDAKWTLRQREVWWHFVGNNIKPRDVYHFHPEFVAQKENASRYFLSRNCFMVDNSDAVIAVYDGRERSGTGCTMQYARQQRKPLYIVDLAAKVARWELPTPEAVQRPLIDVRSGNGYGGGA